MNKTCCSLALMGVLTCGNAFAACEVEFNADTWCISTNGIVIGNYEYNDSVPAKWTYASTVNALSFTRQLQNNVPALEFNLFSISAGNSGQLNMGTDICVPRELIVCDTILATLTFYAEGTNGRNIDTFQLIATTNDWASSFTIGDGIPIRDASYSSGWRTNTIPTVIDGLSQLAKNENFALRIGVKVTAGGKSYTFGYLHGISIDFKACATPTDTVLMSATADNPDTGIPLDPDEEIDPGVEYGRMSVAVNVSPADKIEGLVVTGVLSRVAGERTITVSNELENVNGVYCEKLETVANRIPFEAGERISYYAFTKYRTTGGVDPLGKVDEEGYAYEFSDSVEYTVGKKGSVWVNEIGFVGGDCYVELCGTTNRSYRSGWMLVLSGHTNVFDKAFDFASNMTNGFNGVVGAETYKLEGWGSIESQNSTLELINPAGVVEFTRNVSMPAHYQMIGRAGWHGVTDDDWSYDWTGTATDDTFEFVQSDAAFSPGSVNVGQGFIVPVTNTLYVTTLIKDTLRPLPYASVTAIVADILNDKDSGNKSFEAQTDLHGTARVEIHGYSDDASDVLVTNRVSAFAWKSNDIVTNISLYGAASLTNFVNPTVAYDGFSELNAYWAYDSTIKNNLNEIMYWVVSDNAIQLDTRTSKAGIATLTTKSYMSLRNKRYIDIAFDLRNEQGGVASKYDTVTIVIADTSDFTGTTITSVGLSNKSSSYGGGVWYSFREFIEVPTDFATEGQIWIRVNCASTGNTFVYTAMDNLRVAALDSVNVNSLNAPEILEPAGKDYPVEFPSDVELDLTPLTRGVVTNYENNIVGYEVTTNDVAAGAFDTLAAYEEFLSRLDGEVVVSTVTNLEPFVVGVVTNSVREVAAELVMTVNNEEVVVPFHFGDGNSTNDISAAVDNELLTIAPANITASVNGGLGFLPGDVVEYYARVSYDPDDADEKDENGNVKRDVRYYPDNSTSTNNGWYVKGDYLPAARSFNVGGPALSVVGEPSIGTNEISFDYHAWDAAGITNLAVTLSNVVTHSSVTYQMDVNEWISTNAQRRVTDRFDTDGLVTLDPNTSYTLTITGVTSAGGALVSEPVPFTTLPEAPTVTIKGVSTNTVSLTATGNAAGYKVVPADWTPSASDANTWTKGGGSPNQIFEATVYALNAAGGESAPTVARGYTLAAVATKASAIEKNLTSVAVGASEDYAPADDGNPEGTEYAVRVTTSSGRNALVASETGDAIWKTLAAWQETPVEVVPPTIDLSATNYFSFVTRNFDRDETVNDAPVMTNCWFEMTAGFADGKADQAASPFGSVDVSLNFTDPAQSADAQAEVEYKIGSGEWTPLCSFPVPFDEILSSTNLEWDAWAAVGQAQGTYEYSLRARVSSGNRASEWSEISGSLDFAPPSEPTITGLPGTLTNQKSFTLTASGSTDPNGVTYHWTFNGVVMEGNTFDVVTVADGDYTVSVKAVDAMGNESAAANVSWKLDATVPAPAPTVSGLPGALTNQKSFTLTASGSTDDNGVTYRWTFNGVETDGDTFDVSTEADGEYSVSVVAVDNAGNESEATTVSWTLDATAPAPAPTVTGLPGALTNQKSFTLTASGSADAHGVTYRWTFNDVPSEGNTFDVSTEADGDYSVSVVAVDNAGNESAATTLSWTLDATAPAPAPAVTGLPGALTNQKSFTLTASGSTDENGVTYRWTFNGATTEGNTLAVATETDGDYSVSVVAVDNAGNVSAATTVSWKLDATAPAPAPVVTGLPGALTKQKSFTLTASGSTDPNGVTYRWTFNGATTEGNTLAVATETDGDYSVSVVAVDNAGNESAATTVSWKLDATAPAPKPTVAGLPGALTNQKTFTLTASGSTDDNGVTYRWTFNGATTEGDTFDVSTAADGDYSVSVVAVDNAGNASEATVVSWELDATVPTLPVVSGSPAAGSVVNEEAFSFTAASEDATEVSYHWIIGEREETFAKDIPFVGNAAEGTNTVGVYATDLAGNVSATNTFSWVLDTINPSDPVILGKPAVLSKVPGFAMSAVSQDATALTYHWTIVGGAGSSSGDDGAVFSGTSAEGTNTVSVYATDEAGNVSTTVVYEWVLDTTKPTELAVEGTSGVVATKDFSFTASADDATEVIFRWSITGGGTGAADGEGDAVFSGTAVEGTNTVSVYAEDAAGNRCDPVEIKWVVDMTAPTAPEFTVKPGNPTKIPMFAVIAASEDATRLTYHWTITGGSGGTDALDSAKFSGIAVEGLNTVSVYATDEAGNESPASTYEWKLDTMVPSKLNIAGTSGVVGTLDFVFTASAEDDSMPIAYRWLLNGVEADSTAAEFTGTVPEGTNTVVVSAIDAAGNECGAIEHTWVADVTAPTEPQVSGVPGEVTNVKSFTLTASGTTDVHQFTYNWIFGEQTAEGETFDVAVEDDDVYEVLVYARDEAGNSSTTNKVAWTLDTTAPKDLAIGGTPEAGSSVNTGVYSFTASAKDATAVRYSWTFGETKGEGETFAGTVSEDGVYTVSVVAVDAAGNESEPVARTWTYDTVNPTVELTTASLDPFNEARAPWIVTATFSEAVTNFTAQSVTVSDNATVGNVVQILEAETPTYTFEVTPSIDGDVTVSIAAGAVADAAGNGNEASNELTRRYDATKPTVTLSADVGRYFTNDVFTVTATFSEVVTNFTANGITVDNGAVAGEISGAGSVYTFAVEPAVQNGEVSISISADAATDAAGNGNEASEPLTLARDTIGPSKPVISGTPENGATVDNSGFTFTAETSDAVSKPEDMTYFWVVDGKILTLVGAPDLGIEVTGSGWNRARMRTLTGKVTKTRTYTIYVVARDEAGNSSPQSDVWTWTYTPSSSQDVEFGDGICVKVDPDTGVTNSVSFTSVDFRPGETSTFVLDGFDASTQEIEEFAMWFVVKDTLDDDAERRVRVNSEAVFDSDKGELTVTLPPEAIEGKDSLFIIGIDNAGK